MNEPFTIDIKDVYLLLGEKDVVIHQLSKEIARLTKELEELKKNER